MADEITSKIADYISFYGKSAGANKESTQEDIRRFWEEMREGEGCKIDTSPKLPKVGFKRLSEDAMIPTKSHPTDSGFDLYAAEDVVIHPGETEIVKTDIAVQLPEGMEAQVRPRSGITSKGFIQVHLGTIDNGYTGNIGIIAENKSNFYPMYEKADSRVLLGPKGNIVTDEDGRIYKSDDLVFTNSCLIRKGDKIAQLVVQYLPQIESVEVEEIDDTLRGDGGFGSTGVSETEEMIRETISDNYEALKRMEDD